ncbi:MAG: hypothetical protein Q8896_06120 [Bacteroidota bacterium]|nr:hypothetical protein [Bacteroidota bacterium]
MQKIPSLRSAGFSHLLSSLLLSCLLLLGTGVIINGCSAGPADTQPGLGTETTTIYGKIVDESGTPLMGVTVTAGDQASAITNLNGLFILKDAVVPKGRANVIAKKAGYFNAARAESPSSDGTTRMQMSMMSDAPTANVSATAGGTVNMNGGASVKFSPGSFTDASGNAYTGNVSVSARYLDPSKSTFYNFFSGDNAAQRLDGSATNLVSCGVLRVELKGSSGQSLKLDPTKPATLTCPKPADPRAPNTLQLWSFDETLGMWKEESNATLQGNAYVGTVTHFTDYNFDYCGVDNGLLQFRIVCNGAPIGGVVADVLGRKVQTGTDGIIHIKRVAADGRPVAIDVQAADNGGLYYLNAPIPVTMVKDQTTDAGDITLSSPCPAELSGSVMCDDAFVQGLVMVSDGKNVSYVYTKTGKWALQVPSTVPLTVDVTNANGDQATTISVPALASGEQRSIGTISLCSSGVPNYTDITVGTTSYDASALALSPDGSRLGVWGSGKLSVFDTKNGNLLSSATTNMNSINIMEFSLDGSKLLASDNWYGPTIVYDVSATLATAGASIPSLGTAHLSDDGTKVIALSRAYQGKIMIFSAVDGSVIKSLSPVSTGIESIGYIPGEDAVVYQDGQNARVWGVATDAELRNFPMTGVNYYFASSEDGHTIASSSNNSVYSCYDTKTGTKLGDLSGVVSGRDSAGSILVTQNYGYIEANVGGAVTIRVVKIVDGTSSIKVLPGAMVLTAMAASRNEAYLAASQSGKVRIWKLQ